MNTYKVLDADTGALLGYQDGYSLDDAYRRADEKYRQQIALVSA